MKVRCINNTGADLREFEKDQIISKEIFGRFGVSSYASYEILIGTSYLVMGIVIFESYQAYLIDDRGFVDVYPCQLFEVEDNIINPKSYYRVIEKEETIYPFVQAVLGYQEFCLDKNSYEKLIIEKEEDAIQTYFRRKTELEEYYKSLDSE